MREPYAGVPNWLVRSKSASREAKAVYMTLASYTGADATTFLAIPRIAKESGYGQTVVRRALRELLELGVVTWQRRFKDNVQMTHLYRLETAEPESHKAAAALLVTGKVVHTPQGGGSPGEAREEPSKKQEQLLAPPPAVRPPRPRDPVWDSVVSACGIVDASLTKSGKGAVAKAVSEIRSVGATPEQVAAKAKAWSTTFPGAALTPLALAKHWAQLGGGGGQPIDLYGALR